MDSNAENPGRRSRRTPIVRWGVIVIVLLLLGGGLYWWRAQANAPRVAQAPAPIPVTVIQAATRDVPIYLDALGTIGASNTVAVRSQIDGMLQSVNFTEGQEVKKGDILALIDPRPLQAALAQAVAKKAQDQAQLIACPEGSRALPGTRQEELRDPAEPRSAAGQGRPAQGHDRCRSGGDRQRADAALLRHHHGAVRRPRRLPPGRCRQHHPCQRPESADGADPDTPVAGDLHAAAEESRRRARGDAARTGHGARLRSGQHQAARRRPAAADRQPDRSDHQHDPAQGAVRQRRRPAVARRIRALAHPGRHQQGRGDHSAGGAAARPAGLLCLGDQARQHRRAAPGRGDPVGQRHRDRDQGPQCRRAGGGQRPVPAAGRRAGRRQDRAGRERDRTRHHEHLRTVHPPADRDLAADGGAGAARHRGLSAAAGGAAAAGRFSDHLGLGAACPGASPDTMASTVAAPLERQFGQISGVTPDDVDQHARLDLDHAAIRSQPQCRRRRPGRAGGDHRRRSPTSRPRSPRRRPIAR